MSYRRPPAGWRPTRSLSPTQTHIHIYTCIQWDTWVISRQIYSRIIPCHVHMTHSCRQTQWRNNVVPEVGRSLYSEAKFIFSFYLYRIPQTGKFMLHHADVCLAPNYIVFISGPSQSHLLIIVQYKLLYYRGLFFLQ